MLRKTGIAASILFALSTPALAVPGFYLGAGVGPQFANIHQDSSVTAPGSFDVINKSQVAGAAPFVNFFGGYGWHFKRFYFAGEANADISSDSSSLSNGDYVHNSFINTKYKMYNSFGLSILPGLNITDSSVFYARLGYEAGSFRVVTSDISLKNINVYLSGFRYGFGLKETLCPNLAMRMEYSHVSYTSLNMTTLDGIVGKTTTLYPQTGQVEFALIYTFA
jgi:opacity protein-like surface antigen